MSTEEERARKREYIKNWRRENPEKYKAYQAKYREKCREERARKREEKEQRCGMMSAAALFRRKADRAHFIWLYEYFNNKKQKCKT